jgi:hypothetical protein
MGQFLSYISSTLTTTGGQLLLIFGPILLLAIVMQFFSGAIERKLCRLLGIKLYLLLFGWLGTCVHESGHALFCIIFRHKINEIKFFKPDLDSGTLGYVNHSYNPKSIYQSIGNFFIGIGPIILGSIVIYIAASLFLGEIIQSSGSEEASVFSRALSILGNLFHFSNLLDWKFYLFLYVTLSVGGAINLSPPDLKGATKGFISVVLFLLLLNFLTLWIGGFVESAYAVLSNFFIIFYVIMIFSILMNLLFAFLIPPILRLR